MRRGVSLTILLLFLPAWRIHATSCPLAVEAAEHRRALAELSGQVRPGRRGGGAENPILLQLRAAEFFERDTDSVSALTSLSTEIVRVDGWLAAIERELGAGRVPLPLIGPPAGFCCENPIQRCYDCPHGWPQNAGRWEDAPLLAPLAAARAWLAEHFPQLPVYAP